MTAINDIAAARTAITTFLMTGAAALPELTRDQLIAASGMASPVDQIMQTIEALYAAKDALSNEARTLVAGLVAFVQPMGWHGINDGHRGGGIVAAMLRDMGEPASTKSGWPDKNADPAPSEQFLPAPAVEEPIADAGGVEGEVVAKAPTS